MSIACAFSRLVRHEGVAMTENWIAVASAEHVRRGRREGFMQVCHGKAAPLRRIHPGDRVVYYSPTVTFGQKDRLQAFTAIGIVRDGDPYQFRMSDSFCPFRRDVAWLAAEETPIQPLLDRLEFSSGNKNWGYQLRLGLFAISEHDVTIIAAAMQVAPRDFSQAPRLTNAA
jgi:hypothetical protein